MGGRLDGMVWDSLQSDGGSRVDWVPKDALESKSRVRRSPDRFFETHPLIPGGLEFQLMSTESEFCDDASTLTGQDASLVNLGRVRVRG